MVPSIFLDIMMKRKICNRECPNVWNTVSHVCVLLHGVCLCWCNEWLYILTLLLKFLSLFIKAFSNDVCSDALGRARTHIQALPGLDNSYILEGPAQVEFCSIRDRVYVCQLYTVRVYTKEFAWDPSSTHWTMIGLNMTAPSPLLSSSSVPPPPLCHCAFVPSMTIRRAIQKLYCRSIYFLKIA
jgi:hypothetical protein